MGDDGRVMSRLARSRLQAIRRVQAAQRLARSREAYRAYWRYRASLPHDPMWNLIPRRWPEPWPCGWHGTVSGERCAECVREAAEYRETGTWEDRRFAG